jgi:hypothetical protein
MERRRTGVNFSVESMRQLTKPSLPEAKQEELLAAVS